MGGAGVTGLIARLDKAAAGLAVRALAAPGAQPIPTADWLERARREGSLRRPLVWRNTLLRCDAFERLHVEFLAIPGEIAVLHLCGFPWPHHARPILGFDVVAGDHRATGCFLDLSPTIPAAEGAIAAWRDWLAPRRGGLGDTRVLPEWAAIFSADVVAVRPRDAAEFEAGLAAGAATLEAVLSADAAPVADPAAMRLAMADYVAGQRRNDRTRRMLAGCIGQSLADAFIDQCLFPAGALPAAA